MKIDYQADPLFVRRLDEIHERSHKESITDHRD